MMSYISIRHHYNNIIILVIIVKFRNKQEVSVLLKNNFELKFCVCMIIPAIIYFQKFVIYNNFTKRFFYSCTKAQQFRYILKINFYFLYRY